MYLESLVFENIRGFRTPDGPARLNFKRDDGGYAGWTVLAGRNGSGKTTFLRAISLALAGPNVARTLVPSFSHWVSDGAESGLIQAAFSVGEGDALSPGGAPPKRQPWAGLRWERTTAGPVPEMTESLPPSAPKLTARRGPWSDNPVGWFMAGYGPFRRLTGAAAEAQRLMLGNKRTSALVTLFDESASLAESTWWLQELYPKVLEGDAAAKGLQDDVIRMLDDGLLPEHSRVSQYNSDGLWIEQNGNSFLLEEMSDGYRVVSALVLDVIRRLVASYGRFELQSRDDGSVFCSQPGVVLIDEVDVHLHVSWQQRIGFWMREHFPAIQFIVSTHSPFIVQAASSRGLIRLAAPDEADRVPRVIEQDEFRRIVNGDADQVVMSELFGLETTYGLETNRRRDAWREAVERGDSAPLTDEAKIDMGVTPSDEVAMALARLNQRLAAEI